MNLIKVEGIRVYAYHGCKEEEALIGNNFSVDVFIETDFSGAAFHDDISKTIDYAEVVRIAKEEMAIRSKLIEHVARRIHERIMRTWPETAQQVEVRVTKYNPPIHADVEKVSVTIS